MKDLDRRLAEGLETLRQASRLRSPRQFGRSPGARSLVDGREIVNFASNNYLDLTGHPEVLSAAKAALEEWGTGSTASRLMGGSLALHRELEEALARHKGTEAALVFPSGYHANLGTIPALMGPEDTVFLDRLAHASLVDGARLSRARLRIFSHNDPGSLDRALARAGGGERWVLTESVFSMDGDQAPLAEMADVCAARGARLYVDEAHGTGVWGPDGRGWINALGVEKRVDVCMGTLSKALGSQGGFVAGSKTLIQWIQNRARAFIFSTALAPAAAAAALAALRLSLDEDRRSRLFALSKRLRAGLGLEGEGPIVPLLVGKDQDAVRLSETLWEKGILAPAVRPPTVPAGTARIRFSVTAGHSENDIDQVLAALNTWRGAVPA